MGNNARARFQATPDVGPPDYRVGHWYFAQPAGTTGGSALSINAIRCMPVFFRRRVKISALGVRVTTLGDKLQLALYRANARTLNPMGQPLGFTGDIDISAAGNVQGAIGPIEVRPGLHWIAENCNTNGVAILQGVPINSTWAAALLGADTQATLSAAVGTTIVMKVPSVATPYGTWPDASTLTWLDASLGQLFNAQFLVAQ